MRLMSMVVVAIALVASAQSSLASVQVASGDPIYGNSWAAVLQWEGTISQMRLVVTSSGDAFVTPGIEFTADSQGNSPLITDWSVPEITDGTVEFTASGSQLTDPYFRVWFDGEPFDGTPLAFELYAGESAVPWQMYLPENSTTIYDMQITQAPAHSAPEPASMLVWTLLGACGIGFGWRRWRKRAA